MIDLSASPGQAAGVSGGSALPRGSAPERAQETRSGGVVRPAPEASGKGDARRVNTWAIFFRLHGSLMLASSGQYPGLMFCPPNHASAKAEWRSHFC